MITADQSGQEVPHSAPRATALIEGPLACQFFPFQKESTINDWFVSCIDDDQVAGIVLFCRTFVPNTITDVNGVVENDTDTRVIPVLRARSRNALPVQDLADGICTLVFLDCEPEDLPHRGHFRFRSQNIFAVFAARCIGYALTTIAIRYATSVEVTTFGIFPHTLQGFSSQVHRVKLIDNLDHPFIQKALRGLGVEVFSDGFYNNPMFPQQ